MKVSLIVLPTWARRMRVWRTSCTRLNAVRAQKNDTSSTSRHGVEDREEDRARRGQPQQQGDQADDDDRANASHG